MTADRRTPALHANQRLGPYEVISPLGAGGMGEVWRASDSRLDRDVAVKVLPGDLTGDPERLRRFEQEARAAGRLNHPNVLTVFDVGSHDGVPYIVFELLAGSTLRERLAGGALPLETAREVAVQIARGLAAAHEKGIVHRDLKPENVFVTGDGLVKILDFGLAKLAGPEPSAEDPSQATLTEMTAAGVMLGTVGYMSPEQALGRPVDARSDVFSFGAVLLEMLTGRRAFRGSTPMATLQAIVNEEAPDLASPDSSVPAALATVARRCLEKPPERRFASARDLLDALSAAARPAAGEVVPAPAPRRVMLVVLPFENLSRDPEQEYFSDGLTEETIADLGGVASDRLGVIARTSAMAFKGTRKGIAEIGRELGVDYAVEGSVRRRGERVRISVQLIRTSDQTHVWAQQYDRDLNDFLAVQDELGRAIAEQVQVKLAPAASIPRSSARPVDQAAYDAYLHGLFHLWRVTPPHLEQAIRYFREAAEIDPEMASARAGLAQAHVVLAVAADRRPRDVFPVAEREAMLSLALDPDSAEANAAMIGLRHWFYWDWAGAEAHGRRALASNPSSARAHQVLGRLLTNVGRHDEAIAAIDVARRLDPFAPLIISLAADFRMQARRYDEARELLRKAHEIAPEFWVAHVSDAKLLIHESRFDEALVAAERARALSGGHSEARAVAGFCLAVTGRRAEAERIVAEMERQGEEGYIPASRVATVHLGLGDATRAMSWLWRAAADRAPWFAEIGVEPRWDPLRGLGEFRDLVRHVGLTPAS
jgi:eukaryotic-like serine/threonine-protein kinase